MKITTSKQFALDARDLLKGAIVAGFTAGAAIIGHVIELWSTSDSLSVSDINYQMIIKSAFVGFIGYLSKNFLSPSQVVAKVQPPETIEEVQHKVEDANNGNNPS